MRSSWVAYIAVALLYTLSLSVCAWSHKTHFRNKADFFHLVVAWVFPPICWGKTTQFFIQKLPARYNVLVRVGSLILTAYCLLLISGLMGAGIARDGTIPLIIALVLWYMVPVVTTIACVVSCVKRMRE